VLPGAVTPASAEVSLRLDVYDQYAKPDGSVCCRNGAL